MNKNNILKDLNPEQKKAVVHKNGPLLIIAGAGTGKTGVITKKIAYIIEKKWAKPSEILALTFTEKAAAEMEARVDSLVPYGYVDSWISTFHSFGDRLIREFSFSLSLPIDFNVLSTVEQAVFIRENIYKFELKHFRPISNPLSHIQELIRHFSRLKDELIDSKTYLKFAKNKYEKDKNPENEKILELANAYTTYNKLMLENGNLDYGDQIFMVYSLLKNDKSLLGKITKRFKYILVDEFQDTNFAQNELVKLIAGKKGNITACGDDDQSIYRFRGASISNILDFEKYYTSSKQIVLKNNYRSTSEILDASYKLIQHNNPDRLEIQNKIDKRLISKRHGKKPELIYCDTLSCEADKVVEKIKQLKKTKKYLNKDFAILVRANNHSEPFIQSLNISQIPYAFSGASSLYSKSEVLALIAFLKSIAYSDDNHSFYQLATSEFYKISHSVITEIFTLAKRQNQNIQKILNKNIEILKNKKLKNLIEDIEKYKKLKNKNVGQLLHQFLTEKNFLKKLNAEQNAENEIKILNISKFFAIIDNYIKSSKKEDVLSFLDNLELITSVSEENVVLEIDPGLDVVNILTVHSAKGLEWPVVFIVNCVAERFPSRKWNEQLPIPDDLIKERLPKGDWHLEEERRLFYVAATRAKDQLYVSAAQDYGGKRVKKLSNFVYEFFDEVNVNTSKYKLSPFEKINMHQEVINKIQPLPKYFQEKTIRLSRQQIDDYYSCPKKFYFAHILKIPLLKNPDLIFGNAIHSALGNYFLRKINNRKNKLSDLLNDYKNSFENMGFISREHEDQMFERGERALMIFYKNDKNNKISPSEVEKSFEFILNNAKVNGRYDLVFSNNENPEIWDIKTSERVKEQKDADRRIKESTQMMMYALAWQRQYGKIPKTILYFIEPDLKGEIVFTQKDLDKTQEIILNVQQGIRKNNMKAKPDFNTCQYCSYRNICSDRI